jgi:putative chitinase
MQAREIVTLFQKNLGVAQDGVIGRDTARAYMTRMHWTPEQAAHFFGQIAEETGNFTVFEENLNYSGARLVQVFRKYFPTLASTTEYAGHPEKIANKIYANRMGNGPESSGDGWKYRGRGAIQLTGKNNYIEFSKVAGKDIVDNPDLVESVAFMSAQWFFDKSGCTALAKKGVADDIIRQITKKVNGGYINFDERKRYTEKFYKLLKS